MAIRSLSALEAPKNKPVRSTAGKSRRASRLRLVAQLASLGCLAIAFGSSGGCNMLSNAQKQMMRHDGLDEFMVDYRNRSMAAKAWHCNKHRFCDRKHLAEFQAGFYAGYAEVAQGGTGCTPCIVPKDYWGWKYQSADGQAGVNAWFEGFPMGVQAAEQDGIGHWSSIRPMGIGAPHGGAPMDPGMEMVPGMQMGPEIHMEGVPAGPEIMLETGPQILMNGPDQPQTQSVTSGKATGMGLPSANATKADSVVTPVTATSAKPNNDSIEAMFGMPGANASVSEANDDELPFSFK